MKPSRKEFIKTLSLAATGSALFTVGLFMYSSCRPRPHLLETLRIQAPPSPPSIALAKLVDDKAFEGLAGAAEFVLWKNPDEMRGRITSGQAHISGLPVNVAATLFNRGIEVQLTNVYIWSILYLLSTDAGLHSWEDLEGAEIVIPFRGDLPDIVTQVLISHRGMELGSDIRVRYVAAAPEAAALLVAGQAKHAILSEPSATVAIMQAQQAGIPLHRVLDLQEDWGRVTGQPARIPLAGTVVLPDLVREGTGIVERLQERQAAAVAWVRQDPERAAALGTKYIPVMPRTAMRESLTHINMEYVSAAEAREEIEYFFDELARISPALYGDRLPGDAFYYAGP